MRKYLFGSLVLSILLSFSGCGGGGSSDDNNQATVNTSSVTPAGNTIRLVDGYIENATIKDSAGNTAAYTKNGNYVFGKAPTGKIYVYGGTFKDSNAKNKFDYVVDSKYKIISPLTHYISKYPTQKTSFLKNLGLEEKDLNQDFVVRMINDTNDTDTSSVQMAKTAQILYALEVNDKLKDLKNVSDFQDMYDKSINLVSDNKEATDLIAKANSMNKNELIKAEANLAKVKTALYSSASKDSGVRLDGTWGIILTRSNCKDTKGVGEVTISFDEEKGYKFDLKVITSIYANTCDTKKGYGNVISSYYENVKYPLPVSEFEKSVELTKLLTDLEASDNLLAQGLGVTLNSPEKFTNKSKDNYGTAAAVYTKKTNATTTTIKKNNTRGTFKINL